mmetsp:Transcript_70117/g.142411  ORF Transcript_70117/g.142411 Transcript_70117/m.142411 type:complete len:283 (+) Transcript_70117:216-1064(+)
MRQAERREPWMQPQQTLHRSLSNPWQHFVPHSMHVRTGRPCGQGLHTGQRKRSLPWMQPSHFLQDLARIPCQQSLCRFSKRGISPRRARARRVCFSLFLGRKGSASGGGIGILASGLLWGHTQYRNHRPRRGYRSGLHSMQTRCSGGPRQGRGASSCGASLELSSFQAAYSPGIGASSSRASSVSASAAALTATAAADAATELPMRAVLIKSWATAVTPRTLPRRAPWPRLEERHAEAQESSPPPGQHPRPKARHKLGAAVLTPSAALRPPALLRGSSATAA